MPKIMPKDAASMLGANPYNKRKEWEDEGKTGEEFVSADDRMAYVKKAKTVVIDKMEDKEQPKDEATPQGEDTDPTKEETPNLYQKVDFKKRYDDLKKHYDKKVNEFKRLEADLKEQLKENRPKYTPPKTKEELEEFKKDNPDIFGVVETVAHLQASDQLTGLQESVEKLNEKLMTVEAERAYLELKTLVPDFEKIRGSEAFHEWAEQQPQEIQDWVYNNRTNVQLAAQAINLYKASTGAMQQQEQRPPESKTQDQRGSADQAVTTRSRTEEPSPNERVWTNSEIKRLSLDQYEGLRNEIDKAFAEGRVVMD